MTKEEAKSFLINISYQLGNMGIEYLTEKDGEKMREAIEVLEQPVIPKQSTGKWIVLSYGFSPYGCSECGAVEFSKSNYCPKCGTKMIESEE